MTATASKVAYSVPEAAEATGVSPRTIQRAIKATDAEKAGLPLLPAKRIGVRNVVITADDLKAWVDALADY